VAARAVPVVLHHLLWVVARAVARVVLVKITAVIVDVRNSVVGSGCVLKMEKIIYMVFLAAVGNGSALLHLPMALRPAVLALVRVVNGACPALPIRRHKVRNAFGIWIAQIQKMMNAGR
jgi:hypothetical protein